ncbi:phenylacetate-CoA oxygenase/reductase subunit PaaK [soil metagenome]
MAAATVDADQPTRTRFHPLRVARVEQLCDDAAAVTFDVPEELAEEFAFRPGQSLTVRRSVNGTDERRSYSICSPAGAAPRIGVREVPDGALSPWLVHEVEVGDEIEALPPQGRFVPDLEGDPGRHVMIAAGSGITPILSIAASVLADPGAQATVLYGNRRTDTVMFLDELSDLKDRYPSRFQLVHVLSREPRDAELFSGRMDAQRLEELLATLVPVADVDHWWLCGPHEMVDGARQLIKGHGVPIERIHRELFYVEDEPPPEVEHDDVEISGDVAEATVTLDGRTTTVPVPVDTSILDAAQRVRSDLPFACKGGVCGTCRAQLHDGEVRMRRNFALDDDEVAQGFVLTCQALPTSDKLTVDYDA